MPAISPPTTSTEVSSTLPRSRELALDDAARLGETGGGNAGGGRARRALRTAGRLFWRTRSS